MHSSDNEPVLIYTTWPDADRAAAAGGALVAERLAACVNILGAATAIYVWQSETQHDVEHPMLIKTRRGKVAGVVRTVRRLHPYDVPAVSVWPIDDGDPEFLAWITAQTTTFDEMAGKGGKNDAE